MLNVIKLGLQSSDFRILFLKFLDMLPQLIPISESENRFYISTRPNLFPRPASLLDFSLLFPMFLVRQSWRLATRCPLTKLLFSALQLLFGLLLQLRNIFFSLRTFWAVFAGLAGSSGAFREGTRRPSAGFRSLFFCYARTLRSCSVPVPSRETYLTSLPLLYTLINCIILSVARRT